LSLLWVFLLLSEAAHLPLLKIPWLSAEVIT